VGPAGGVAPLPGVRGGVRPGNRAGPSRPTWLASRLWRGPGLSWGIRGVQVSASRRGAARVARGRGGGGVRRRRRAAGPGSRNRAAPWPGHQELCGQTSPRVATQRERVRIAWGLALGRCGPARSAGLCPFGGQLRSRGQRSLIPRDGLRARPGEKRSAYRGDVASCPEATVRPSLGPPLARGDGAHALRWPG
jgi:hypothetical protein